MSPPDRHLSTATERLVPVLLLVAVSLALADYVVMLTTLGGMTAFGINGFVLGLAIAAMFIAVWHLDGLTQRDRRRGPPV